MPEWLLIRSGQLSVLTPNEYIESKLTPSIYFKSAVIIYVQSSCVGMSINPILATTRHRFYFLYT